MLNLIVLGRWSGDVDVGVLGEEAGPVAALAAVALAVVVLVHRLMVWAGTRGQVRAARRADAKGPDDRP